MKTAETHFKEYFKGPGYTTQKDLEQWGIAYATEVLKEIYNQSELLKLPNKVLNIINELK